MKHPQLVSQSALILHSLLLSFLFLSFAFAARAQPVTRKVDTWYIYKEGKSSFKDLEPFKDIIRSISVFGSPPKSFIAECHQHKIEVYHAVSDNEKAIDSPEKIKAITQQYVNICNSIGYDGIDLDYEALKPQIKEMYSLLLKELSAKLHQSGKKLSQCVGFYNSLYQNNLDQMFYDVKVLSTTCDLVRVMCYDMYYAPGRLDKALLHRVDCQGIGGTSNYPFVKEAMTFWLKYVPKEKLVMGLPAYSNDYEIAPEGKGMQLYASVPESIKGALPSPTWLWFEKINLYVYNDTHNTTHLFYASDAQSTEALLSLANELEINNIGFWHFSSVDLPMWEVTQKWISTSAEKN